MNIQGARVHMVIASLVAALISGHSISIDDSLLNNIMQIVLIQIANSYFPESISILLNIAFTFLDHENDKFSCIAHKKFSMPFLIRTLVNLSVKIAARINNKRIREHILPLYTVCLKMILISISRYSKDVEKVDIIVLIHELAIDFAWTSKCPELCILLCKTIVQLFNDCKIVYSDFNKLQYPALVSTLLKSDATSVQSSALDVIGNLNADDRYDVPLKFSECFYPIKYFEKGTDPHLLSTSIFACTSFLVNKIYARSAHEEITKNFQIIKMIYDNCSMKIKWYLLVLFQAYIRCFMELRIDDLAPFKRIIITISETFLELFGTVGNRDKRQMTQCLLDFASYIHSRLENGTNQSVEFLTFLINELRDLDDKETHKYTKDFEDMLLRITNPQQQGQEIQQPKA